MLPATQVLQQQFLMPGKNMAQLLFLLPAIIRAHTRRAGNELIR